MTISPSPVTVQLLADNEQLIAAIGYEHVWVATGGRAIDFYRKCGWELSEIVERASGEVASVLTKLL